MDINKLIDFYDREQKTLFTAFCISFPLSFTELYFHVPDFTKSDLYIQFMFSASLSIVTVTISFIFVLLGISVSRFKRDIRLFHVILPNVVTLIFSSLFRSDYTVYLLLFLFIASSASISFSYWLFSKITGFKHEINTGKAGSKESRNSK